MIAKLIARTGPLAGQDFTLPDTARIGAAKEAEVRVRADGVSRSHARMYRDGDHYWLEDASSTNGTFLNGQRVQRERLRHLDVITLGRNVDLIFICKAGEAPVASATAGVQNASFMWLDGPEANATVDVTRGEVTIGRAASCNIVVDSAAVSKVHARLVRTADQVTVQDLGSANGTFVNGKRVTSVMVLTNRDRVGLAGVRNFVMSIERDPSAAAGIVSADSAPGVTSTVFDQEWKTRLVWSPEEMQELEAARAQMRAAQAAAAVLPAAGEGAAKPKAAVGGKPVAKAPPPARVEKPAEAGAAPAVKAPPPVPPRAAAAGGEAKGPPPLPPRAPKPDATAGEVKGPPPLPPRAAQPPAAGGEVKGPPPLPPRAPKPDAAAGEVKGPPPLPPRVPKPDAAAGEVKGPPPLPARSAKPAAEAPPRTPPASPAGVPAAPPPSGTGMSASDPAKAGAQPTVPRPDQAGLAEPGIPKIAAPASAAATPSGSMGSETMPPPHVSPPPPERRTGPLPAQPRAAAPTEGKPIRSVRLTGDLGTFTLEAGTFTVGRSETAEVRLDDREVSRAHAILIVSATSVSVEDQKSANGTFINGVEVKTRSALRSGDKLMFGGLEFTVQIET